MTGSYNHCAKHKRFIPHCKDCETIKNRNEQILKQYTATPNVETVSATPNIYAEAVPTPVTVMEAAQRKRPYDKDTKRFLYDGRAFERVLVPHENFKFIEHYFMDAAEWGYDFFASIPNALRAEVILIFKKK